MIVQQYSSKETRMRLRTILSHLGARDFAIRGERALEHDMVACPDGPHGQEPCLVALCNLAAYEHEGIPKDFGGTLIVDCGEAIPSTLLVPPERVVAIVSDLDSDALAQAFADVPRRAALLSLAMEQVFKVFLESYDLQRYANGLHWVLDNPLIILNTDHRLLATAGDFPAEREDVLREIEQGYLLEEVNDQMEADGVLAKVRHSRHSVITENTRYGQRWVTSIIYNRHLETGRLDILEQDQPVDEAYLELVDYASALCGLLIDRLGMAGGRAGAGSSVLTDILKGSFVNEKTMRSQLALTSVPLDEDYVLVAIAREDGGRINQTRLGERLGQAMRHLIWAPYKDVVVALVAIGVRETSGYDSYDRAERRLLKSRRFLTLLEHNELRAFVSEPFDELGLAPERVEQCLGLRDARLPSDVAGITMLWHHRYVVAASMAKTFGELDLLIDKRVIAMALYDRDHGTDYLATAKSSVLHPGSPGEAAKALNVHRNTYFYRINKVAELFYLDLKNGEDRLAVSFSTRILEGMGERIFSGATDRYRAIAP